MMNTDVTTWMTAALSVFEQLHCGGAWYDFVLVVIRCLITRLVMSFILEVPSLRVCCSSPLSCRLFSGQNESASSLFFFCSFWHTTKLIASEGIGEEGLVLFWQFFQEWPSIRWSIVLARDLSLLNSWLAAKSRCYNGIETLQGIL